MTELSSEARAIIEGRHSDPFHYLGRHRENGRQVIRTYLPDASEVLVVDDGTMQHGPSDPPNQGALLTVPGIRPSERRREHASGPVEADRRQDENDEGDAAVVLAEAGPL